MKKVSNQEIKDQHFLPQCYLKGFTNENGKLFALNLQIFIDHNKIPKIKEFTPAQLCYEEDFYTLGEGMEAYNVKNYSDQYEVERSFHDYENKYQGIVGQIKVQHGLASKDAFLLIQIILDLKMRNKYFRDKYVALKQNEIVNNVSDEIQEIIQNDPEYVATYGGATKEEILAVSETVRETLLNDPDFKKKAHLSSLHRKEDGYNAMLADTIPKIMNYQWIVFESEGQFIANDNPGFSMDDKNKIHNSFFEKNFIFFMPLSSSLCLTISDRERDNDFVENPDFKKISVLKAPQGFIDAPNTFALRHFNKFIFGPDKEIIEVIAKGLHRLS